MDKELLKGSLDIVLLIFLSKKYMYGYEIAKEIKDMTNNSYQISEGTLYPALKRMEDKKFLESFWEFVGEKDLKRKYYKITKEGTIELQSKLDSWRVINNLIEKSLLKGVINSE